MGFNDRYGKDILASMPNTAVKVGNRIKEIRLEKGLTRKQLAAEVGDEKITDERIQKYERGVRQAKNDMILKIANALNVSVMAIADPDLSNSTSAIYGLFELEKRFGMFVDSYEKDGMTCYCLAIKPTDELIYKHMQNWFNQYQVRTMSLKKAQNDEERHKIEQAYKEWEWQFPGADNSSDEAENIKQTIASLQEYLDSLTNG